MADLTEAQIREILAGCDGVTPGPWEPLSGAEHAIAIRRNEDGTLGAGIHAKLIGAVDIIDGEAVICIDEDDRSHIARLDPATVAALISATWRCEAWGPKPRSLSKLRRQCGLRCGWTKSRESPFGFAVKRTVAGRLASTHS